MQIPKIAEIARAEATKAKRQTVKVLFLIGISDVAIRVRARLQLSTQQRLVKLEFKNHYLSIHEVTTHKLCECEFNIFHYTYMF